MNAAGRRTFGVVAVVLLAALVACGKSTQARDADPATKLNITVTTDESASPKVYTLTCDPAGGNHPEPKAACALLSEAGTDPFEPIPADQACTQIYGGPQTATVSGSLGSAKIDARFSRQNGCEIDRWDKLGTTFFAVPLQ